MKSKNIIIKKVEFEDIIPGWEKLWPGREYDPYSSMLRLGGYDPRIRDEYPYTCIAAYDWDNKGKLVGVQLGHKSAKRDYRTRGLWVDPNSRGQGIAQMLFERMEMYAKTQAARYLWSFPRLSSLPAYMKAGYEPYGEPVKAEYEQNVKAQKDLSVIYTSVWHVNEYPFENLKLMVDTADKHGLLLGQNEEVRGNSIHVTQHWINDYYADGFFVSIDNDKTQKPSVIKKGDLMSPLHVF
jgi:GNAT superfamily N-acetyltransferase